VASRGCHEKRCRAQYQPEAVVPDFVNLEFVFPAVFFSALRFLVAVSSDLSGCSCILKAPFSELLRRLWNSLSLVRSLFFIANLTPLSRTDCPSLEALLDEKNSARYGKAGKT
jgi:hypothetical protein